MVDLTQDDLTNLSFEELIQLNQLCQKLDDLSALENEAEYIYKLKLTTIGNILINLCQLAKMMIQISLNMKLASVLIKVIHIRF